MCMQLLNKYQATKAMRELKEKYTYRMGSMPEFMKCLKQRFSRWYNKRTVDAGLCGRNAIVLRGWRLLILTLILYVQE